MLSHLMVDMEWKPNVKKLKGILMWNYLDVQASEDHFLKSIFKLTNEFIRCPSSSYIGIDG